MIDFLGQCKGLEISVPLLLFSCSPSQVVYLYIATSGLPTKNGFSHSYFFDIGTCCLTQDVFYS